MLNCINCWLLSPQSIMCAGGRTYLHWVCAFLLAFAQPSPAEKGLSARKRAWNSCWLFPRVLARQGSEHAGHHPSMLHALLSAPPSTLVLFKHRLTAGNYHRSLLDATFGDGSGNGRDQSVYASMFGPKHTCQGIFPCILYTRTPTRHCMRGFNAPGALWHGNSAATTNTHSSGSDSRVSGLFAGSAGVSTAVT